ncbi:AAA family ATPase [Pseudophaeobacter arcticus]|uniref:AAA family ATPase n=1 Tax=Pseudophaeobacter arcticus TaxID=385492 RepID=UPI000409EE17|nr:AAA family ATPase [Pseudophaeobacter arcticus]
MTFSAFELNDWQQFDSIKMDLSAPVTIITGTNGSGKTTLVSLLSSQFGARFVSHATPMVSDDGEVSYTSGFWGHVGGFLSRLFDKPDPNIVGTIKFEDGNETKLKTPNNVSAQYIMEYLPRRPVPGIFLPSHRPSFLYQKVSNINTGNKKSRNEAYHEFNNKVSQPAQTGGYIGLEIKTTLLKWLIDGSGVKQGDHWARPRHAESENNYIGFMNLLRNFLPPTVGFDRFEFKDDELVFVCKDGRDQFLLETASGGVTTLISLAWLLYNFSQDNPSFTLIVDEIEHHLHPSLQREILGMIHRSFPKVKIIVTTHSPLVVNSVENAKVYALRPNERDRIEVLELPLKDKLATANRILDDVLGVGAPYPIWAERKIDSILSRYLEQPFNQDVAQKLQIELENEGVGELMHAALGKWLDAQNQ